MFQHGDEIIKDGKVYKKSLFGWLSFIRYEKEKN